MNYRHAFHAGNFADVVKHAALALILSHLTAKPKPLTVIDSHAGRGAYDLDGEEARRTGERAAGIDRVGAMPLIAETAPYLVALERARPLYPGSPLVALAGLRPDDRLIAVEKHAEEAAALRARIGADPRAAVHARDGYEALVALAPPPAGMPRRGLILIDPPYEATDEVDRTLTTVARTLGRWPSPTVAVWYPIKDRVLSWRLADGLERLGRPLLIAELTTEADGDGRRLTGCGLAIVNPPWRIDQPLGRLLDALRPVLATGDGAASRLVLPGE